MEEVPFWEVSLLYVKIKYLLITIICDSDKII